MQLVKQRTKQETVYSRLSDIPRGSASDQIVDGCLVLEGGAFRGLYTQGFLDAMMQNDLNMSSVIGVSAGALGGMNYVSGQIGRSARINLGHRHDGRYVGAKAALHSRSLLDISFLVEERGILEPFDETRFFQPERTFVAVATNCLTGEPEYFEKGKCPDIVRAVRASATMPYISPMVKIDGVRTGYTGLLRRCTASISSSPVGLQGATSTTTTSAMRSNGCIPRVGSCAWPRPSRSTWHGSKATWRSSATSTGSAGTTATSASTR